MLGTQKRYLSLYPEHKRRVEDRTLWKPARLDQHIQQENEGVQRACPEPAQQVSWCPQPM